LPFRRLLAQPVRAPPNADIFAPPPAHGRREIVLLVAPQATGKTTLTRRFTEQGYVRVNQDTLKTVDKCLGVAKEALLKGRHSVVIDNMNLTRDTRAKWLELGRAHGARVRCVRLCLPEAAADLAAMRPLCVALEAFRMVSPQTPAADKRHINSVTFNTTFGKQQGKSWPAADEGFDRVDTVHWSPAEPVDCPVSRRLYHAYL